MRNELPLIPDEEEELQKEIDKVLSEKKQITGLIPVIKDIEDEIDKILTPKKEGFDSWGWLGEKIGWLGGKIREPFGPPKEYKEVYAPEFGRMVPGYRREVPLGTKIIERLKFEWESDWPQWLGLGIYLGTYGIFKYVPIRGETLINRAAKLFAKNNLAALKKRAPDVINTLDDASTYSEMGLKQKLYQATADMSGRDALKTITEMTDFVSKYKLPAPEALPMLTQKITGVPSLPLVDKLISVGLDKIGAEALAGSMHLMKEGINKLIVGRVIDEFVDRNVARTEDLAPLSAEEKLGFSEVRRVLDKKVIDVLEGEVAPKAEIPPSMEHEINTGGGPVLGMGIELTDKQLFTEPKEKNSLGKAVDRVTSWFSVYHKMKEENPEAYRLFRHFKGGQDLAWINARQKTQEIYGKISNKDALKLQRYRQNPEKYPFDKLPENLKPAALRLDEAMEDYKNQFIAMRKMKVGWPQSYIDQLEREKQKLTEQIPLLKQKKAIQRRQNRIKEIEELQEVLSHRRFFPGRYIVKPESEASVIKLLPEGKFRGSQVRSRWIKGKTIPDIDAAIKLGLEPFDSRRATLDYLYWAEIEKNKWVLYEGIKEDPNLAMRGREAPDWWDNVAIKELKGYKVNPLITDVLEELASSGTTSKQGLPEAYMKLARYGKIASFYNPIIMGGIYDPQQGYLAAGVRVFNPVTYTRALKGTLAEDEFHKELVRLDLYPKPVDLGPQRDMDQLILSAAKQMDESCSKFTAFVEKATDGRWNFKGGEHTKNMIKTISGLYSVEWNVTWTLDAASRRTSVKVLMARGWPVEKAVERARFYHADYGDIPSASRRFLNMAMWTPSYQISMAKVYGNMARHPIKERGPLARLIAFWLLVGTGSAIAGYKWQEGYRFVKETEEGEDVITGSGPLFFLHKYLARDPKQSAYYQSAIPIHIVWSIAKNRDWKGDKIYEEVDNKEIQVAKTAGYIIRTYFRPLEAMARMTDQDEDLLNRLLAIPAVSKYTRQKRERYTGYLIEKKKGEYRAWRRRYPEEPYEKQYKHLQKEIDKILAGPKQEIWQKAPVETLKWIREAMEKRPRKYAE